MQLGHEAGELNGMISRQQLEAGSVTDVALEGLDERLIGEGDDPVAAAVQDDATIIEDPLRQFAAQAGLTDAGLARDRDEAAVAAARHLPVGGKPGELVTASDELQARGLRRQGLGESELLARRDGPPADLPRLDRRPQPLELEILLAIEAMPAVRSGEHPDDVGAQHRVRLGGLLETGGFDRHDAGEVAAVPLRLAGAHPDAQPEPLLAGAPPVAGRRRLEDPDPRNQRLGCRSERGHEAVALSLHELSTVIGQDSPARRVELAVDVANRGSPMCSRSDVDPTMSTTSTTVMSCPVITGEPQLGRGATRNTPQPWPP